MKDIVFCESYSNEFTPLHSLYEFLWTQEKSQEILAPLDFMLPHTILIKEKFLGPWFFSDKKKMIRKKKAENLTTDYILEQFGKRSKNFPKRQGWKKDVVAVYIYSDAAPTEETNTNKSY